MPEDLSSGRLIARNALLNLAGRGAPIVAAVVAIPILIDGLGTDRFGLLALAWVLIGYFTLFDLGIGRSLTQVVSQRLGTERTHEVGTISRTGLVVTGVMGVLGALALFAVVPPVVQRVLNVPGPLEVEAVTAFRLLALAVPAVVSTAALRGILEATQRFGTINAGYVPMGVLLFLGPVAVLPFSRSLVPVMGVLAGVRIAAWLFFLAATLRVLPPRTGTGAGHLGELLRVGGWMTVSNVVSSLMVHLDRFVIGAVLSLAAVTYYATPFEAVTKMVVAPVAVVGVFFPAFALTAKSRPERTGLLFGRSMTAVFAMMFPLVLIVVAFAPEALGLWVGDAFTARSTGVARWLAVGVFFNALAQVPLALVQGTGRADVAAKLHLLELPAYLTLLWLMMREMGITGAALAWSVRTTLDCLLLSLASIRLVPATRRPLLWTLPATVLACAAFGAPVSFEGAAVRLGVVLASMTGFALVAWKTLGRTGDVTALFRVVRAGP